MIILSSWCLKKWSFVLGVELGLAEDGLVRGMDVLGVSLGVVDCVDDGVESHIAMINQAKDACESVRDSHM